MILIMPDTRNKYIQRHTNFLFTSVLLAKFIHNPLAIVLPLCIPLLDFLGLSSISLISTVDITDPFLVGLVFEVGPAKTVLGQGTLFHALVYENLPI